MGKWKYESEWTNEVSMVLTGAAFYHKVTCEFLAEIKPFGMIELGLVYTSVLQSVLG